MFWPSHNAVTGFCSRFLLAEAQYTSIEWEAAVGQWLPALEQRDVLCVCVCVHLLFSAHRTTIVMSLALCSNIWLGASASFPPGFLLGLKEERQVKNHILNCISYREGIIMGRVKCQIKCKHWLSVYSWELFLISAAYKASAFKTFLTHNFWCD